MKAIVIGTGRMGKAISACLSQIYPGNIGLYGRDYLKTQQIIQDLNAPILALKDGEQFAAEIIIHTLWFNDAINWVNTNKTSLAGKILIDISNPFNEKFDDFTLDYNTSAAEELQQFIPDTEVVGAFKNTYWVVFENPTYGGIKSDIYVTSNKHTAREKVIALLTPTPFRVFDAGNLKNNRTIERMTLLEKELAQKAGNHPRVSFHLWGV